MPLYRADCANHDPTALSFDWSIPLTAALKAIKAEPQRPAKVIEYDYWKSEADCPHREILVYDPKGFYK